MAVRVLLVLAACAIFYGCGQASSPVERQEEQGGMEQAAGRGEEKSKSPSSPEATTERAVGNIPISGIMGENVEASSFDLRVLDYFVTDHYYYNGGLYEEEDAFASLGKFIVVNYSLTNTSSGTTSPNFNAYLHAQTKSGKVEVYEPHQEIIPPHAVLSPSPVSLDDLPARQMFVSQFIFDVPRDVEAELLVVDEIATLADPPTEVGVVDLTESDPLGPRPEEIYALKAEYQNMADYERAYELFAQETKDRISEQTYTSVLREDDEKTGGYSVTQYSFPSVNIEGNRATMQVVESWETQEDEGQERITQEAVLEDAGWRIVMRDSSYKFYEG
jgi:hypothetical protein